MTPTLGQLYLEISAWLNNNQGVVGCIIFLLTLAIGWLSGIFSALRRRPKFKIKLIEGPTFCCTYEKGKKYLDFKIHQTGIALYLHVSNIGSAASSIENISIGYHWHLTPFSIKWLRYRIGWFWLTEQAFSLSDFQVKIGSTTKCYPFLVQKSHISTSSSGTFLQPGQSQNGVVYFEQDESWGGCFPTEKNNTVKIKIRITDTFGVNHAKNFLIPSVDLAEARKYNPSFGKTFSELRGEELPFDQTAEE